jgi:hypothetical protein
MDDTFHPVAVGFAALAASKASSFPRSFPRRLSKPRVKSKKRG